MSICNEFSGSTTESLFDVSLTQAIKIVRNRKAHKPKPLDRLRDFWQIQRDNFHQGPARLRDDESLAVHGTIHQA